MTPDEQVDLEIAALLDAMKDMELQIQKLLHWERTVKILEQQGGQHEAYNECQRLLY